MNKWISVTISACTTFTITAGTAYVSVVTGTSDMPNKVQIITCVIGGLVAAARDVQKNLQPPPV